MLRQGDSAVVWFVIFFWWVSFVFYFAWVSFGCWVSWFWFLFCFWLCCWLPAWWIVLVFFFALVLVLVVGVGVLLVVVEWLFGSFLLLFAAVGVSDCVSFLFASAFVWFFCFGVFWHCVPGLGIVWGFSLFVFVSFVLCFLCFCSFLWRG